MCFQKLKKLFIDPVKFFKDVSKEKDYWTVLKFFVVTYLAATLIQVLVSIPIYYGAPEFNLLEFILRTLLFSVGYAFLGPFIVGAVAHLGILILGGKKGFFNTFKALTYGTLVVVSYGMVSLIISGIIVVSGIGVSMALANSIILIILLTGSVHMLITQSIGVSTYHSISRIKAFLGIIFIPIILFIILIVLGIIFTVGLFSQSSLVSGG